MTHGEQEQSTGKEIWPGTPQHTITEKIQQEIDFCRGLDKMACQTSNELVW